MSPAEEVAYLKRLAAEIAQDTRFGSNARLVASSIITGRADGLEREDAQ